MKTDPIVTHRHDVHTMIPETFQFLSQPRNIKCSPIQAKTSRLPLRVNVVNSMEVSLSERKSPENRKPGGGRN